ncbi:hypothetical protein CBR_g6699 [Chara braunii]|uniref:Uncharacterized protein n=1 Tax=Chara braunii TaxID=69332 RepID=A0A388KKJ1_CHABU|nr:hypothetical protein CBR_g6699 [Chara braunii]|eukprot:GBG70572.1 hypothetical protein CBR_g6699 [Chara braunii]
MRTGSSVMRRLPMLHLRMLTSVLKAPHWSLCLAGSAARRCGTHCALRLSVCGSCGSDRPFSWFIVDCLSPIAGSPIHTSLTILLAVAGVGFGAALSHCLYLLDHDDSGAMAGNVSRRNYVFEKHVLIQSLDRTEAEVARLHRFLVTRADNFTITLRSRGSEHTTDISLENIHDRHRASSVLRRLRESRDALRQCCDDVVGNNMQLRRQLDRWRRVAEDMRERFEHASRALDTAVQQRDDAMRRLESAEEELRVARAQAETAWRFYDEVLHGVACEGMTEGEQLATQLDRLCVSGKGKGKEASTS